MVLTTSCVADEKMARPEGLEPPTYGFEARRSIQLSYRRTQNLHVASNQTESYHVDRRG